MLPSKLSCQNTSNTWYNSCSPTLPPNLISVAVVRMLALPLNNVESVSFIVPAAACRTSIKGSTVCFRWLQKISRDLCDRKIAAYSCTATSCSPESELPARPERYVLSLGMASSVCDDAFPEAVRACAMMLATTAEVRSALGSSWLDDWVRNGKKGLYGSGCSMSAVVKVGMSGGRPRLVKFLVCVKSTSTR